MTRYSNVPMSLADGCLVRLMELKAERTLLTLDGDFSLEPLRQRAEFSSLRIAWRIL